MHRQTQGSASPPGLAQRHGLLEDAAPHPHLITRSRCGGKTQKSLHPHPGKESHNPLTYLPFLGQTEGRSLTFQSGQKAREGNLGTWQVSNMHYNSYLQKKRTEDSLEGKNLLPLPPFPTP